MWTLSEEADTMRPSRGSYASMLAASITWCLPCHSGAIINRPRYSWIGTHAPLSGDDLFYFVWTTSSTTDMAVRRSQEAMSHSGLMHALLAIAALHRSHFDSCHSDHYRSVAMRHQSLSLPHLRSLLNDASAENCNALFAHSTIIVVFAFALPQLPIALADFDPFQEIITIIELVKGISAVAGMTRDWILRGPLRSLLRPGAWEVSLVIPEDIGDALNCLFLRNDTLIQSSSKRATYNTTIGMLRKTFGMLALNPADHGVSLL
jgi:hypothetical protein